MRQNYESKIRMEAKMQEMADLKLNGCVAYGSPTINCPCTT